MFNETDLNKDGKIDLKEIKVLTIRLGRSLLESEISKRERIISSKKERMTNLEINEYLEENVMPLLL